MKKIILSLLAIAAMTSCTKSSEEEIDPNAPVEIKLQASIDNTPIIIGRSAGAVDGLTKEITDVALVYLEGTTPTWTTVTEDKVLTTSIAQTSGTITLPSKLYFPADGSNANFIGYHPKTNCTLATGTITFTGLNGQQDIMYAPASSGNKTTEDGCIKPTFSHKLSQLKFQFEKDASYAATATIKELKINGTKLPVSMNLSDGVVTYEGTSSPITVFTDKTYSIAEAGNGTPVTDIIMVEAGASITADITITIDSKDINVTNVPITLTSVAGKAHLITLTFKQKEVSGQAEVAEWANGDAGSGDIY